MEIQLFFYFRDLIWLLFINYLENNYNAVGVEPHKAVFYRKTFRENSPLVVYR